MPALLLALACPSARGSEPRVYALVVGNNLPFDSHLKPLRYADDDAARFAELLTPLAHRVELLAVLDSETQPLYPELARRAGPPTRVALLDRMTSINQDMLQDKRAGLETVFYFVYVGHGVVGADREGSVSLLDGPFTRGDLYRHVIASSTATVNHIIIDACDSYLMVAARGALADDSGPDRRAAIREYLQADLLARYPNTGVLLSTSQARESHEWSLFRGGVFSHEVRSAMAGAADANGDGRVEYSEVKAFVAAANLGVKDPRAKLEIFARPPALDAHRPLLDLGAGFKNFMRLSPEVAGHYYLEDARGVRYADLHKAAGSTMTVALVPSAFYYLRNDENENKALLPGNGTVEASHLAFKPIALAARGSLAETFERELFRTPYGPSFYSGYTASSGDVPAIRGTRVFPPAEYAAEPPQRPSLLPNPY